MTKEDFQKNYETIQSKISNKKLEMYALEGERYTLAEKRACAIMEELELKRGDKVEVSVPTWGKQIKKYSGYVLEVRPSSINDYSEPRFFLALAKSKANGSMSKNVYGEYDCPVITDNMVITKLD